MKELSVSYRDNIAAFSAQLRTDESFDLIRRTLRVGDDEMTFFYIDGFVKDDTMLRIFQCFLAMKELPKGEDAAHVFAEKYVPYVEVDVTSSCDSAITAVLSGAVLSLGSSFGKNAVVIDARTYPSRPTEEPESDRVMQGAHDGFVETLIFNTALIRRRIRDPRLTMHYINMGGSSRTDVVLCYMDGVADPAEVEALKKKLASVAPRSLTMGMQSLAETLIRRRWYNPFPKIRTLERPDAAAAEVIEGRILVLCDTSPQVMVLPTSIFDFMQETEDYYFPPFTGCYMRIVRHLVFWLSLYLTPLYYLLYLYRSGLPQELAFLFPVEGNLPLILQLFLVELAIDGLKLASMNTPSILTNSLSIIGGLILGDFAVEIGWLSPQVIFYMALVAIAGFSQQSYELGYAFKFMRMILLALTALLGIYGFVGGLLLTLFLIASNKTLNGKRSYLYPLLPFDGKALRRLFFRSLKEDIRIKDKKTADGGAPFSSGEEK